MNTNLRNNFEFTGELAIASKDEDIYKVDHYDSGWDKHHITMGIRGNSLNAEFLQIEGLHSKTHPLQVYTSYKNIHGEGGGSQVVEWQDRLDEEVVDKVASFRKTTIDLEEDFEKKEKYQKLKYKIGSLEYKRDPSDEDLEKLSSYKREFKELATNRHEFIHPYDLVMFLKSVLPEYRKKKFKVKGEIQWREYNGNIYRNYVPRSIELVSNDTPSKLSAEVNIYLHKDSVVKQEDIAVVNGYVLHYCSDHRDYMLFPETFHINADSLSEFGTDAISNDDKFQHITDTYTIEGSGLYYLYTDIEIFNGAEQKFTDFQQNQIDLGFVTEAELLQNMEYSGEQRPIGENIKELRIIGMRSSGEFSNGAVEVKDAFENMIIDGGTIELGTPTNNAEESQEESNEELSEEDKLAKELGLL